MHQISIGFNDNIYLHNAKTKESRPINTLYLLYDCDYKLVIYDAEQILTKYQIEKKFDLRGLNFVDYKYEFPPEIQLTDQEKDEIINGNRWYVERDGQLYSASEKHNWIQSAHYKEGWKPFDGA